MTRYALLAILYVALLSSAVPAGEFPYSARIVSPTAALRSGPGTQFYATGQLLQDEEVEVYRHVGTWCAIRPTPSSFSYVRADHVRVTEVADVLEISVEGARTRVGSEISDEHKVQYVTLHRGERVRMVGEPVMFGRPPRRWYKIAPPSGEFRWIARADLASIADNESTAPDSSSEEAAGSESLTPIPADEIEVADPGMAGVPTPADPLHLQADSATQTASKGARSTSNASQPAALEPTPAELLSAVASTGSEANATEREDAESDEAIPLQKLGARSKGMSTEPIPHEVVTVSAEEPIETESAGADRSDKTVSTGDPSIDNLPSIMVRRSTKIQPVAGSNEEGRVASAGGTVQDTTESVTSAWTAVDTELPPPPSPQQLDHSLGQLASLELELSRIVTQDIGTWPLEDLQSRLVELRRGTGDPEARRAIEHLWKRAQEFADLQQRHRQLLSGGPAAIQAPAAEPLLPNGPPVSNDVALTGATNAVTRRAPAMRNRVPAYGANPNASAGAMNSAAPAPGPAAYAGQGWLVPVLTSRTDLPRFALTDAQGQILHFVTPAPGLNLRRYLRQQVGIVGSSRAGRTGEPGPLLAERVVVLDRR